MKKLIALVIAGLLLAGLCLPVAAASASMTIAAGVSSVYRGDTVEFSVRMNTVEDCRSGGIILSYNSAVFEFVSGSCSVSGATMSNFSSGTGSFALSGGSTVSGRIFTFRLRVRDDAPFGSYTVTGSGNVRNSAGAISTGVNGCSITVTCNHNYSAWTKLDDKNHTRTCSVCGDVQTQAHNRDGIFVAQSANCISEGSRIVTCSACQYQITETIPINYRHTIPTWTSLSQDQHSGKCTVCGQTAKENHTWDEGTVTLAPTCISEGELLLTCTASGCGATKTQVLEKTGVHTYAFPCDTKCTVCGDERQAEHTYLEGWFTDAKTHFRLCQYCGVREQVSDHVPGPEATATTPQICTECGYILVPAFNHVHEPSAQWVTDGNGHWHSCPGCSEQLDYHTHDFENVCDGLCETCGYTRITSHTFSAELSFDDNTHFYACTGCGLRSQEQFHVPGPAATEFDPQQCDICGHVLVPALGHRFTAFWCYDETTHYLRCDCGALDAQTPHTFDEGVEERGLLIRSCSVCGFKSVSLPEADWRLAVMLGVPLALGLILGVTITLLLRRKRR